MLSRKAQEKMKAFYESKKRSDESSEPASTPEETEIDREIVLGQEIPLPYPALAKQLDAAVPNWREMSEAGLCAMYNIAIRNLDHHIYQPLGKFLGFYQFQSKGMRK